MKKYYTDMLQGEKGEMAEKDAICRRREGHH